MAWCQAITLIDEDPVCSCSCIIGKEWIYSKWTFLRIHSSSTALIIKEMYYGKWNYAYTSLELNPTFLKGRYLYISTHHVERMNI